MIKHYKNGQYGIEVRVPHFLAGTDKEALVASVLKDFAGECYEEMRIDPENGIAYKVYKALYNGSGLDLEAYQALWDYNLIGWHKYHIAPRYEDEHPYWRLMGVQVFPGETMIYSLDFQGEQRQHFIPTDPYEGYGQSQYGIDYARTIMREIHDGKLSYYPVLREVGGALLYPLVDNKPGDHVRFDTEEEARTFLKQYDK